MPLVILKPHALWPYWTLSDLHLAVLRSVVLQSFNVFNLARYLPKPLFGYSDLARSAFLNIPGLSLEPITALIQWQTITDSLNGMFDF